MKEQRFKTVITSKRRLFDLHIKETLSYRDLIFLFVKRDFTAQYKQTILGPLWAIIQPLLTTFAFALIFGWLAKLSRTDVDGVSVPYFLFYLSGTICWGYFSGTLHKTANTFIENRHVMGKVYYPRLVTPIATAFSHLISFGIQFAMFVVAYIVFLIIGGYDIALSFRVFLILPVTFQLMLLATGCGIIISSLTTKYRDLAMLVGFGLQLWQYASPVAYGLALVPEKYVWLYMLNPVGSIITTFRYAMFGAGYFNGLYYGISWAITMLIAFLGLILFSRIERTFMDTV